MNIDYLPDEMNRARNDDLNGRDPEIVATFNAGWIAALNAKAQADRQIKQTPKGNDMAQCIGRIIGRPGDWYAELDFEAGEATIKERGAYADVATMPIGEYEPESNHYDAALNPDCPQAQRLMKAVFAPEAWATLASIKADIEARYPGTQEQPGDMPPWAASIVDQIERTLECLTVPGRVEDDPRA
jgi:hypothetical protein